MGGHQIAKRIPRIKFPDRRAAAAAAGAPPSPAGQSVPASASSENSGSGGAASIQPRRPKVSKEEIEAVLLGGVVK